MKTSHIVRIDLDASGIREDRDIQADPAGGGGAR